jgi:hypothetical protein
MMLRATGTGTTEQTVTSTFTLTAPQVTLSC